MTQTQLITVKQAAKLLGVHFNTVYKMIRAGRIKTIRLGLDGKRGAVRIDPKDLPKSSFSREG
jgi:excisionase family DNA binding protein